MEIWFLYAFASAVLGSAAIIIEKKILKNAHALQFSLSLAITNVFVSIPLLLFVDLSSIPMQAWVFMFSASVFGSFAFLFITKAMRHLEISIVSPMTNINPMVLSLFAFTFLGERITSTQISGIVLIATGAYLLEWAKYHSSFIAPIQELVKSKYSPLILISAILYGFSSLMDRQVLNVDGLAVSPFAYIFIVQAFISFNFAAMTLAKHRNSLKEIKTAFSSQWKLFLLTAILVTGYRLMQAMAVAIVFVSLVIPIKRLSVLFTTIIGGEIFHEKNIFHKAVACIVMLLGSYLILAG
ncbi:MAG: EamA family transporter [Candidatus Diapherotrites archaeon]|nr:EamA family transporter [Candidatus Diapherotrites archaeon]